MSEEREPGGDMGSSRESGESREQSVGSEPVSEQMPEEQMSSEAEPGESGEVVSESASEPGEAMETPVVSQDEAADQPGDGELEIEEPKKSPEEDPAERQGCGYFLKRGLRWAVFVLIVFTIGIVLMQIVRVGPLINERNNLNQSLTEAAAVRQDLEAELDRLQGVDAENQALSSSLEEAGIRLAILNILVDVTRAQLALAQEDTVRVAAALQGTGEKLNSLGGLIDSTELSGLRERLVLVLSEVDEDPFAAERDLEILANTLLEIEQKLAEG